MKTIKTIIADNLKLDFHKTKKDFVVYLQTKRYPLKSNLGTKAPKVGTKFASLADNGQVEFWERITKDKFGNCWKKLGTFTYSEVEKTATHLFCKKQKYLHRDILQDKNECTVFYDDGSSQTVSGIVLVNCLFNGCTMPKIIEKQVNLIDIPDHKLSGEQLVEKMRLLESLGMCPF